MEQFNKDIKVKKKKKICKTEKKSQVFSIITLLSKAN